MKVLMVHEVKQWMLDADLSEYDLITFDDGLFSQYFYRKEFLKWDTPMIFFISTGIVSDGKQTLNFPSCSEAHRRFFENGDTTNYMTWEQIKELHETPNCTIGGHSHYHKQYSPADLKLLHSSLIEDSDLMMNAFRKQGIEITDFCHPYNKVYPLREGILKRMGITKFYGDERIAIEELKWK